MNGDRLDETRYTLRVALQGRLDIPARWMGLNRLQRYLARKLAFAIFGREFRIAYRMQEQGTSFVVVVEGSENGRLTTAKVNESQLPSPLLPPD